MPAKSGARLPPTRLAPSAARRERVLRQIDAAGERVQARCSGPVSVALETHGFTQPLTDSSRVSQLARLSKPSAAPPAVNEPTNVVGVVGATTPAVTGAVSVALNESR